MSGAARRAGDDAAAEEQRPGRGATVLRRLVPASLRSLLSRNLSTVPDRRIAAALADARRRGRESICVAAPFPLSAATIRDLTADKLISGIVCKHDPAALRQLQQEVPGANLGRYWEPGLWALPRGTVHVYFLGSWCRMRRAMLREAVRQQVLTLTFRCGGVWVAVSLASVQRLSAWRHGVWAAVSLASVQRLSAWRHGVWRVASPRPAGRLHIVPPPPPPLDTGTVARMIVAARAERRSDFVPGRVVLACSNLSPGGAERQAAYTAGGLAQTQRLESVEMLCDTLTAGHPGRYDFYLPLLQRAGVPVRISERHAYQRAAVSEPAALARHAASLPEGFLLDVAALYSEFVRLRPEVVHAWLDWSNTRAGLAAALAGVPRIVLSGRNLNPTNFAFYQPYMDPVYQALCALPEVVLLNNSRAGAASYAAWLGLPAERIEVIYNGFDTAMVADGDGQAVRHRLGIPPNAPLVGGVFRLYPEKRPLLWVEAAAHVLRAKPDCWFVMFGHGILQADIEKLARARGIAHRLVMPGVAGDVLSAMRAMDVFLLTSSGEGIPNVVLEAQWVGTPVVATEAGGVGEAIDPEASGWIVDPPDPGALARRIIWLLGDPDARARARIAGPALVRQRFGMQRMIEETLQAFRLRHEQAAEAASDGGVAAGTSA